MRAEYAAYRDRFFAERHRMTADRQQAAWERERLATRGAVARQLAYWSVDVIVNRRRAREYDAGRVRWEATCSARPSSA